MCWLFSWGFIWGQSDVEARIRVCVLLISVVLLASNVNKDWTCKDKDKDKDQAYKDQDKDKDKD